MSSSRFILDTLRSQLSGAASWWPVALVFIPLLLLAGLGIRGLQMSKHSAREGAVREAESAVRRASQRFGGALEALRSEPPPLLYPVPPVPELPDEAQELYRNALDSDVATAIPLLEEIAAQHPAAFTESGLPLLPLVRWRQLQMAGTPMEVQKRAESLVRSAVETHPSVLTPELLSRAESLLRERDVEAGVLQSWRVRWGEDERVREALRKTESLLKAANSSSWVRADDELWWAEPSGESGNWRLIAKNDLTALASEVVAEVDAALPDYAALQVAFAGMPLLEESPDERLAQVEEGGYVITGILLDPAKLYAQQRKQTLWLAALLGCAVLAAGGGTWMMNAALARERQLSALKSDFVSSISHELRAPVASMRIMAENLGSGIVSDEARRREYHQLIAAECWRLGTLIENVLDLARIERNRKIYRFAESDVTALVRDAVQLMQPRAAQRRQELRVELAEEIEPAPVCDSLAVQQALINLLDNAIKFSPEETVIIVTLATRESGHWELSVADRGPGIPEGEERNVFDRFYRLGSELRRETQGAGIGLSIVKHIAEGHGGSAVVKNLPDRGAKFSLLLPLVPPGAHLEPNVSCLAS